MSLKISQIRTLNQRSYESFGDDVSHAEDALRKALAINDVPAIAESNFVIGQGVMLRGRSREAFPLLMDALALFAQAPAGSILKNYHSALHVALGSAFDDQSDYLKARHHHRQALELADLHDDAFGKQRALLNMGYVHYKLGQGEVAINYIMESLRHPCNHPMLVAGAHEFMADVLEQQGLWAMVLQQRSAALDNLVGMDSLRRARVRCGMAVALLNMQRESEALESLDRALQDIAHLKMSTRELGKIQVAKAQYYLRRKDFVQAWQFCDDAARTTKDCGSFQYTDDVLLLKAEIELMEGRLDASQATCTQIGLRTMSFHRQTALRVLQERICRESGDWPEAYALHLETEALQHVDLKVALDKKEEMYRIEMTTRHNRALQEKNLQLETMSAERDDLMHLVVHDLANYLQATRNSLDVMGMALGNDAMAINVNKEVLLQRSVSSLDMMEEVLGQLRLLWEVEANSLDSVPLQQASVADIIAEVVSQYRDWAESKGQTLVFEPGAVPVLCHVHPQHMAQIMSNLISNAIKYSGSGACTRVSMLHTASGMVDIQVEDQGQGMTETDLKLAFQRFRRLSAKPTAGEPSNGLGLYLVKRLANEVGGNLSVSSPGKGQGSVFRISVPVASSLQQTEAAA